MQVSAFLYLNHMRRFPKFIKASLFVNETVTMTTKTRKKSYLRHHEVYILLQIFASIFFYIINSDSQRILDSVYYKLK